MKNIKIWGFLSLEFSLDQGSSLARHEEVGHVVCFNFASTK